MNLIKEILYYQVGCFLTVLKIANNNYFGTEKTKNENASIVIKFDDSPNNFAES